MSRFFPSLCRTLSWLSIDQMQIPKLIFFWIISGLPLTCKSEVPGSFRVTDNFFFEITSQQISFELERCSVLLLVTIVSQKYSISSWRDMCWRFDLNIAPGLLV